MMQQALNSIRRQWFKVSKKVQATNSPEYVKHLSVIWSRPLSDFNRVIATNQFALPVLNYLMWTQHWPITELRAFDRETRKAIHEKGGKHPLISITVMYLPWHLGGRGLRSVEQECKLTKIKDAVKLYKNVDPKMRTVRMFEERAVEKGHSSLPTEAHKYAEETGDKFIS